MIWLLPTPSLLSPQQADRRRGRVWEEPNNSTARKAWPSIIYSLLFV
jgi:hypothetical protein